MTNFKINEKYYGFILTAKEYIEDINSDVYLFNHEKSGARLIYVSNDDKNRVFFTTFKTPPENHKGTAHIMEHSVLCGSEKYRVKDPFNELAKGSLNTYLNALTYADKTVYPIGSTNEKDFENLMNVYIDAVFNPLIYERKEIFLQEGWHYEFNEDKTKLKYTGVVYNEMKGAFSDPERILAGTISESLFSNSPYKYESGGDPEYIPQLTYNEFIDFHKKYYHPSNSYIYLYGHMNIEKHLKYIDEEYLSKYEKTSCIPEIKEDNSYIKNNVYSDTYSAQSDDEGSYIAYNIVTGKSDNPLHTLSMDILSYILFETNDSAIKRKLVDSGIAEDIEGWYDSSTYETVLSIVGKNCDLKRKDEFKNIILSELKRISDEGIDRDVIKSSLNVFEFHMREENYGYKPKGLAYGLKAMKVWLHNENPFDGFYRWKYMDKIREESEKGYFENIIKDCLIDNEHSSLVVVSPEIGKQAEIDKKTDEKLDEILSKMSDDEKNQIIKENESLREYQNRTDTKQNLESIPVIEIDEIEKSIEKIDSRIIDTECGVLHFTPYDTNKIVYSQIVFDTRNVPENLIEYAGLLTDIMGKMGTKKYSFRKLPTEINMYTGDVSLSFDIYTRNKEDYTPVVSLNGKAIKDNMSKMFELFDEIVFNTVFDNKDDFKNVIKAEKLNLENKILNNAHMVSSIKALSHFADNSIYKDRTSGIAYYKFLCDIEKRIENDFDNIIENIKETYKHIFNKNNVIAAFETDEKYISEYKENFENFVSKLPDYKFDIVKYDFDKSINSEAFTTGGKIVYDAKATNYKDYGYTYSGDMNVLKTIINLEYLWNVVRVQGGAYGSGCQILKNGNVYCYSYRDPNIKETLDAFDNIGEFISNFNADEREMKKYIIGTINNFDRPKSMAERADISFAAYMCNISDDIRQKERDGILSADIEKIRSYGAMFDKIMKKSSICVIGNESKINENKNIFEKITDI